MGKAADLLPYQASQAKPCNDLWWGLKDHIKDFGIEPDSSIPTVYFFFPLIVSMKHSWKKKSHTTTTHRQPFLIRTRIDYLQVLRQKDHPPLGQRLDTVVTGLTLTGGPILLTPLVASGDLISYL